MEAATDGWEFVPQSRIKERFGKSLADNYPEAGPAFLRFAVSYWTLKLLSSDLWDERATVVAQLIAALEAQIGSVFFPTPGPVRIDPVQRETTQRALLTELAPRIDLQDFIGRNPILLRDAGAATSGCSVALSLMAGGAAAAFLSVLG
jgi:hypothetical protein